MSNVTNKSFWNRHGKYMLVIVIMAGSLFWLNGQFQPADPTVGSAWQKCQDIGNPYQPECSYLVEVLGITDGYVLFHRKVMQAAIEEESLWLQESMPIERFLVSFRPLSEIPYDG